MLTPDELATLEALLQRARHAAGTERASLIETVHVGDIVQLRPGADPHWETSLLLVGRIRDDGGISGAILRPHRGGVRDVWYTYRPPEIARIGHSPFPEPAFRVKAWNFEPPCMACWERSRAHGNGNGNGNGNGKKS